MRCGDRSRARVGRRNARVFRCLAARSRAEPRDSQKHSGIAMIAHVAKWLRFTNGPNGSGPSNSVGKRPVDRPAGRRGLCDGEQRHGRTRARPPPARSGARRRDRNCARAIQKNTIAAGRARASAHTVDGTIDRQRTKLRRGRRDRAPALSRPRSGAGTTSGTLPGSRGIDLEQHERQRPATSARRARRASGRRAGRRQTRQVML